MLFDTLLSEDEASKKRKHSNDEIVAILGHELGHWKLSHAIEGFINAQVYLFATFLLFSKLKDSEGLHESFGFSSRNPPVLIALMLFGETFGKILDQVMTLYMTYRTRCNEYAADAFAVGLGKGNDLITSLIKLNSENLGNVIPDKYYAMYHNTHPTLVERVTAINALIEVSDNEEKKTK